MRNLLAFCAALLVTAAIAGHFLGWYRFTTTPTVGGHRNVTIDINTVKMESDVEKGFQKVEHMIDKKGQALPVVPNTIDGSHFLNGKPVPPEKMLKTIPEMIKEGSTLPGAPF
jgi:hypothetical protein